MIHRKNHRIALYADSRLALEKLMKLTHQYDCNTPVIKILESGPKSLDFSQIYEDNTLFSTE